MTAEYEDDYPDDDDHCYDCHGGGWKLACPDDLCHGTYEGGPYSPCGQKSCLRRCMSCNKDGQADF